MGKVRRESDGAGKSGAGAARLGLFLNRIGRRRRRTARGNGVAGTQDRPGRVCSWAGERCVFGLHWTHKPPSPLSNAALAVGWRGMHAVSNDGVLAGMIPLSAVIADSLEMTPLQADWQGATIIAAAKPKEALYWAAIFSDAVPVAGDETVLPDLDALIAWIQQKVVPGEIERVRASPEIAAGVQTAVPVGELAETPPASPEMLPAFEARVLPKAARASAAAACAAALAAAAWLAADGLAFNRPAVQPEVAMVPHELPPDRFLAHCHEALRQAWPAAPGWDTEATGCTFSGMDDPHVVQVPWDGGSAYRKFRLDAEHNGSLARAAARQLLEGWPGRWSMTDGSILLQRRVGVGLVPARAVAAPSVGELQVETESMFLGLAESVGIEGGTITIRSLASIPTVIRRLIELDRRRPISLLRFTRVGSGLVVKLVPRRTVPGPAPVPPS